MNEDNFASAWQPTKARRFGKPCAAPDSRLCGTKDKTERVLAFFVVAVTLAVVCVLNPGSATRDVRGWVFAIRYRIPSAPAALTLSGQAAAWLGALTALAQIARLSLQRPRDWTQLEGVTAEAVDDAVSIQPIPDILTAAFTGNQTGILEYR